jgi:hypothetical protein
MEEAERRREQWRNDHPFLAAIWTALSGPENLPGPGVIGGVGGGMLDDAVRFGLKPARTLPNNSGLPMSAGARVFAKEVAEYAKNVKGVDGFTDVFVHGTRDGKAFSVLHNGDWVTLDHRQLATWLGKQGVSGDIRLISCYSGMLGTGGAAQDLANKLGVKVMAPTNVILVHPNGTLSAPTGTVWTTLVPGGK